MAQGHSRQGSGPPGGTDTLTVKAGLKPSDAAFIGVGGGAGAVAAVRRGEIDAISHLDPVIAKLEADGDIQVLVDTRTEAGTRDLFGGPNPAAVLYTKKAFIDANPNTTQRLTNAFVKALKWLQAASPEQVAGTVPEEYHLGDKPLYLRAVESSMGSYSRDGLLTQAGMQSVLDTLKVLDPSSPPPRWTSRRRSTTASSSGRPADGAPGGDRG
jgi:NitT/TauT family transport system substrate-binding protein